MKSWSTAQVIVKQVKEGISAWRWDSRENKKIWHCNLLIYHRVVHLVYYIINNVSIASRHMCMWELLYQEGFSFLFFFIRISFIWWFRWVKKKTKMMKNMNYWYISFSFCSKKKEKWIKNEFVDLKTTVRKQCKQ